MMVGVRVRDVSLLVEVVGHGDPLLLMHGGPGADHRSLWQFERLADRHTLVFYDHRANGGSTGSVSSMTLDNLSADAEALRERLGFERWSVLGHSFGGHVALEYALRYPASLSRLVLMDTAARSWWSQRNAPQLLARWGFDRRKVELARRWFNGEVPPTMAGFVGTLMRLGSAYDPHTTWRDMAREMYAQRGSKMRPRAYAFACRELLPGWSVVDRLPEISAPTLVLAGREDFVFPPDAQREMVAGLPDAMLHVVERSGHNPHAERTDEVLRTVAEFLSPRVPTSAGERSGRAAPSAASDAVP